MTDPSRKRKGTEDEEGKPSEDADRQGWDSPETMTKEITFLARTVDCLLVSSCHTCSIFFGKSPSRVETRKGSFH